MATPKNGRRFIPQPREDKSPPKAARKAGERRRRSEDNEKIIFGRVDSSDPHWADHRR